MSSKGVGELAVMDSQNPRLPASSSAPANHFLSNNTTASPYQSIYHQQPVQPYSQDWNAQPPYHPAQPDHNTFPGRGLSQFQSNPLHTAHLPQAPSYAQHSGALDPTFSTAPYREPQFLSHISAPPPSNGYNQLQPPYSSALSIQNTNTFHGQPSYEETISPHALQNSFVQQNSYSFSASEESQPFSVAAKAQPSDVASRGSESPAKSLSLAPSKPAAPPRPVTLPPSQPNGRFLVRDGQKLLSSTDSTALPGTPFAFLGSGTLDVNVTKVAPIPKYIQRQSRQEAGKLLTFNDTNVDWLPTRPTKKLKTAQPTKAVSRQKPAVKKVLPDGVVEELSSESVSESESESGSEYYSSEASDLEIMEESSPLPASRPADAVGAIKYDTIKALWRPSRRGLGGDEIRVVLGDYWNVIKPVRDKWNDVEKEQLEKKRDVKSAKKAVAHLLNLTAASIATALEVLHNDVARTLGENGVFIHFLSKVLRDRVKEDETTDSITTNVLELLSRITNLSEDLLEKIKFSKLQARLLKKGNDTTKRLMKNITENATADTKRRLEEQKAGKEDPSKTTAPTPASSQSPSKPLKSVPDQVAGAKRARTVDDSGAPPASKRVADEEKKPSVSKTAASTKASNVATAAKTTTAKATTAAAKPKTTQVAPKATSFFSDLKSASKKPAPTAAKPALAKLQSEAVAKTQDTPQPTTTTSRPIFSLADTLASLSAPKPAEVPVVAAPTGPPETDAEKAKRLRKEERRKLRVTFKTGESLCEVRYFTHDKEEEVGRADNLVRDAKDAVSEGRMFKQHMEMNVADDEEEYEPPDVVEPLRAYVPPEVWEPPMLIDFSVIPYSRRQKNSVTRGGFKPLNSKEAEVQKRREANTLMVVYTDLASIPPSPREPLEETDPQPYRPPIEFGPLPIAQQLEMMRRASEWRKEKGIDLGPARKAWLDQSGTLPRPNLDDVLSKSEQENLFGTFARFSKLNASATASATIATPNAAVNPSLQGLLATLMQPQGQAQLQTQVQALPQSQAQLPSQAQPQYLAAVIAQLQAQGHTQFPGAAQQQYSANALPQFPAQAQQQFQAQAQATPQIPNLQAVIAQLSQAGVPTGQGVPFQPQAYGYLNQALSGAGYAAAPNQGLSQNQQMARGNSDQGNNHGAKGGRKNNHGGFTRPPPSGPRRG